MHCLVYLWTKLKTVDDPDNTVCLLEQQQLPIKAADIQRETSADPILPNVYNFTIHT